MLYIGMATVAIAVSAFRQAMISRNGNHRNKDRNIFIEEADCTKVEEELNTISSCASKPR